MKVILYVQCNDYGDIDVETLQEHQERMENSFNSMIEDEGFEFENEGFEFENFLSENYYFWEIFKMSEAEKEQVIQAFKSEYFANYDSLNDWVEFEKEIEG